MTEAPKRRRRVKKEEEPAAVAPPPPPPAPEPKQPRNLTREAIEAKRGADAARRMVRV